MNQIVAFIRERLSENERWTDYFIVEGEGNPEQRFRDAVKEYLMTEEGMEDIKMTAEDFNWGDAMSLVPDEIWSKHHIRPVKVMDITVNHDEVLVPEEYYEKEII